MAVWEGFACKLTETPAVPKLAVFWTIGGLCDAWPL